MNQRPLSPHLQVYRLPITGWMSILHRITGLAMSLAAVLLVLVPVTIAAGPASFGTVHTFLSSILGRALVWLCILALLFHLCHGLRHLLWDVGFGYSRDQLTRNAAFELIVYIVLAALVWFIQADFPSF